MHPLLAYHERTKHSYASVRTGGSGLDWANEPSRFKRYLDLDAEPLPPPPRSGVPWHRAVRASAEGAGGTRLDLEALSHILFHGAGVTRTVRGAGGTFHFRTYAAAGALYPVEAYVVFGAVEGLDQGVDHYGPRDHALTRLRDGDLRGNLGLAGEPPGAAAVVLTGIPWRTAWKYGPRGFRHLYWDAGMVLANLLAAAVATGVRARVLGGFVDRAIEELLGIDGRTELPLCVVALGEGSGPDPEELRPLDAEVAPVSARPRRDPVIEEARAGVALDDEAAVRAFREAPLEGSASGGGDEGSLSDDAFEDVVRRRGSSRAFARTGFPAAEYGALAGLALAGFAADRPPVPVEPLVVASALEGLDPGAYVYGTGFRRVRPGDLRQQAAYLCLEQRLGADAAAVTFLAADVASAVSALGGRGYAWAQLSAAVAAGRLYLGAYGQCLGATGTTFYDEEVRSFFGTEAEPMLAVALGPEGRRASIRRCRDELESTKGSRPA